METTNKCDAKKREYTLAYKFSGIKTLNSLKKMMNLIDFTDVSNKVSSCCEAYLKDEIQLSLV